VTRFLARRVVLTIPVLPGVATLVFSLIDLVRGDPVQAMLGDSASSQDIADLRGRQRFDGLGRRPRPGRFATPVESPLRRLQP
jgi:ABC-type dipeptide/oligopeptide/nickel transport system permease component